MTKFAKGLKSGLLIIASLYLIGCGDGDYQGFDNSVSTSDPNSFLTFFNRQGELSAGEYTLVVATSAANQTGNFSVLVTRNDGSAAELLTSGWSDSAGPSATPASTCSGATANVCFPIDMQKATGATFELTTDSDGILYLVDDSDTVQTVGESAANGAGVKVTLDFAESNVDETTFSSAYYRAVDPANARDTLQNYQSLHGFDTPGADVHVIFRDSKDLGYGRDMYMRSYPNPSACGGHVIAFYVRNFSVKIIDGFAYGPVNLEGAIEQDLQHHFGSNAIEFSQGISTAGDTCTTEPMTKFYTFKSDYSSPGASHFRLDRINLDDRGAKAMPQPCISCHGGKLRPSDRFGNMVAMHAEDPVNQIGDTKARLQAFEVDTFEFSDKAGHTKADYEDGLRQLNAAVYCSYPGSIGHAACASHGGGVAAQTNVGEWSGDFARDMLLGWYSDGGLETPNTRYDESYVPVGWRPAPGTVPGGADALFKKVVGPNCFVCHGKRGSELGSDLNASGDGKDLDFSTWAKFISHASEIERLVFQEGKMPLGLLNYDNFWDDSEKAELLASFLSPYITDFSSKYVDAAGNIIRPGRVVARAGLDRVTQPNAAITLNGHSSLFSDRYTWSLVSSPAGSISTISSPNTGKTNFTADMDGDYVVRLSASALGSIAATDDVTIRVDNTLATAPRNLSFYNDITTVLANCAGACHSSTGISGIPVWWVADGSQPQGIPVNNTDTPSLGFYEQVMARVNLEFVEDSLILKKPSGVHHYGGATAINLGFDASQSIGTLDRLNYDMFVNWISEGAVCGGTTVECPL